MSASGEGRRDPDLVTEHAEVMGGFWKLRDDEICASVGDPVEDWIARELKNGIRVFRRRVIVVEDWAEVTE